MSLSLCLCVAFAVQAQDLVVIEETMNDPAFSSKRGVSLLPQAGDYALGIDATPFLNYMGNFFGKSNDNNFADKMFNGVNNTIYGKYFLEDDRAIRAKLRLNIYKDQNKGTVTNDTEIANNPLNSFATIVDVQNVNTQDIELYVGYEFRRGRGRVQGFYGGELGLGYAGGKYSYDYGNPMTELNQTPTTTDFDNPANTGPMGFRQTELKMGKTFNLGVGAFVGVEYFFAPQMSIGGELNLAFIYSIKGQSEWKAETFDAASNRVQTVEGRLRNSADLASTAGVRTATTGQVFLMFHF